MRAGVAFRSPGSLITEITGTVDDDPWSPEAITLAVPFSVGNAMGRNKIIYGLSRCTIVVATDDGTGGTWAGATEALKNHYGRVASWTGAGQRRRAQRAR